jgi:hypothetical protein
VTVNVCQECGKKVTSKRKLCLQCGVLRPLARASLSIKIFGVLVFVVVLQLGLKVLGLVLPASDLEKLVSEKEATVKIISENVVDKKIHLKDLTTGVSINEKPFPKLIYKGYGRALFDYEYYGEKRNFSTEINDKDLVYRISVSLSYVGDDIVGLVEKKLSEDNGRNIKFKCEISVIDLEKFGINRSELETKRCTVRGVDQILVIKQSKPKGAAAALRLDLTSTSLELVDERIEKEVVERKLDKASRDYNERQKKARSDI